MSASTDLAAPEGAAVDAAPTAADDHQFVTFTVADELFAVPMAPVQEIIRVPEVARLPLAPPALQGLANLRGRVLPIVDMRRLFAIETRAHDDATRAVVIRLGQPLGFVVDRVSSVVNIAPGELEPATQVRSVVQSEYLSGVINRREADGSTRLMMVLDFERLVRGQFGTVARAASAGADTVGTSGTAEASTAAVEGSSDELRLVSFTAAGQEYAIDIADVQEIVQVPEHIVSVPNTPAHVLGLISLRQRLLPLVSLRSLFGLPGQALGETDRIVVVALPGCGLVGLVTDAVKEVLSVPRAQADDVPGALSRDGALAEFESICRLDGGKRLVSIISAQRLLGLQAVRDALARADAADTGTDADTDEDDTMSTADATTTGDDLQVVVFRLGAEEFGVPIMSVQEIVRVPETLTRVPRTPAFVEGVINLRGTVMPVIDQRRRMGMDTSERNDRQRIMVYTLGGLRTGFIVDSVAEVLRIPQAQVSPAPSLSDEQGRLITQVARLDGDRRLVMLIEPSQMLGAREVQAVEALAEPAVDEPAPLARAA